MNRSTVILLAAAMALPARDGAAQDARTTHFQPEPTQSAPVHAAAPSPSFLGQVVRRDATGQLVPILRPKPANEPTSRRIVPRPPPPLSQIAPRPTTLNDYYVQDGSETAL